MQNSANLGEIPGRPASPRPTGWPGTEAFWAQTSPACRETQVQMIPTGTYQVDASYGRKA